jgi:two-component system response regulator FlrC
MVQQISSVAGVSPRNISGAAEKPPPMHVLVVDDDRLVRWAVAETLTAEGYDVSEAGDAKSAMQACTAPESPADLVLLDLWLPDADDLGVLSFIRTRFPNTPVILMTAFGTPDIVDQAVAQGAVMLAKPFDMSQLARVVARTLRA